MKVVLLAGGFGTRIAEESHLKPKPMIEIGGKPILWHIMKGFSTQGFNEFIICCGYKGEVIKEYFSHYFLHHCDLTFDFRRDNAADVHTTIAEPWQVTLVDTGLHTMTGGRIRRIRDYTDGQPFLMSYGDGIADVNLTELLNFHKAQGRTATMTVVQPEGRFGVADIRDNLVHSFREKSSVDMGWINGGFMVLEQGVFDYLGGDDCIFEQEPLERLARENQLAAYKHTSFWQCMDTQRDKTNLESLWEKGAAPWKIWS